MAWLHDNGDEEELAFDDEEDGEKEGTVEEETEEVIVTERMGAPVAAPPLPASGKSKPKPKTKAKPKSKAEGKSEAQAEEKGGCQEEGCQGPQEALTGWVQRAAFSRHDFSLHWGRCPQAE